MINQPRKKVTPKNIAVGDRVQFKSDVEQMGIVTKIVGNTLWVKARFSEGFEGDYIGGQMDTTIELEEVLW